MLHLFIKGTSIDNEIISPAVRNLYSAEKII